MEVCGKYDCQHIQLPDCTRTDHKAAWGYRITDDLILCTVFGGICIGAAIGLVIRMGASTGGMDIPPLILNKYFKIPVSSSIYVFDMLILLLQVFHSTGEQVLYGILLVIVYSAVLDKCLMLGTTKMQNQGRQQHIDRDPHKRY